MADTHGATKSEPYADSPRGQEQEAVRTTIVGSRPPGSGKPLGNIPRGIEVLCKKALVDPAFKSVLLDRRSEAANEIGLQLEPAEALMLAVAPREQLQTIIASTRVPEEHRRVFLGKIAAAMLGAVGIAATGCGETTKGIRPDRMQTKGISPDRPLPKDVKSETTATGNGLDHPEKAVPSDGKSPTDSTTN